MSRPKVITTCTVLLCVVVAGLAINFPWHIEATFIVEPHDVRHIYTTTPGFLRELHVQEGQTVKSGELLLVLQNPEKEDKLLEMYVQRGVVTQDLRVAKANNSLGELEVAQKKMNTLREQIADFEEQLSQLDVMAPCDGVVIAPQANPQPKSSDETRVQLAAWHGTPIQPRNRDAFLEERTHALSVAPDDKFQAMLLVDQGARNDIDVGRDVELKFDHLPDVIYVGKVEKISTEDLKYVPQLLSNKLGGHIPTVSDEQGREKLVSPAYQTTVLLEEDIPLLRSGMRGTARFRIENRSAWQWIWRYLVTTFHFRL